ncbi:precorrin-3B synthase [Neotabrizicola shimadae]|uniref:Precorrin-3B synthase n=1 Tax=Neotabrizicola shimadae TaxID=2807096 RepID=A0A8G1EDE7_9RHOB|nr:precorrin-3B synthase [Neotabrizicola shimadae]QYZ71457.1 precorrin-3B synthase [Neotabrizicola shimadae]
MSFDVKGWCPGALRPMESGDGWVVRVRVPGGRMTPEQARGIAAAAARHGNGLIDLSARANVQLRGVTMESHAPLIAELRALELIDRDESAEARRNIVVQPFWTAGDGTLEMATALAEALAATDLPLPGKFGFALDTGARPVLRALSCDIRVERHGQGFLVLADGATAGAVVAEADVTQAALDLARWFVDSGGITAGRGRMRPHLARAALPDAFRAAPRADCPDLVAKSGPCPGGALVALAFGQMRAETLAALSDHGALRVTPWRMLLVEGVAAPPAIPGLLTDPEDPLTRVVACTGAPGCPQARQSTRDLAARLAPAVPVGRLLHVSGCAKGCAHPFPADFTLTATGAGFDLVRNGRAGDVALAHSTTDQITPESLTF